MATSATAICNLAISWVAGNRITSLEDDESTEAILCRENYDASRRTVLNEREWTFAVRRRKLNPLEDVPEFGFNFAFQLPTDSLRVVSAEGPSPAQSRRSLPIKYLVEEDKLLADIAEVHIRYIFDLTNTTKFSASFDEALAAHVASKIALPLTTNRSLMVDMITLYETNIQKAISVDSLQGSRERIETSHMEKTRRHFVDFD